MSPPLARCICLSTLEQMAFEFDEATAIEARGNGAYDAVIRDGWDIMGNANGGYLLAIAADAMRTEVDRKDPISVTAHYLSPGLSGPVTTRVSVLKQGRRFATVQSVLEREGKDVIRVIGTFGDVDTDELSPHLMIAPPDMPPYDQCVDRNSKDAPAIFDRMKVRLHPDDAGFATGHPSGVGRMRGWVEFADNRPHDTLSLLLAVDVLAPPIFNVGGFEGWVPTVELTTHIFARPAPGPLLCSFTSHIIQSGMLEEDGTVWDSRGVCVATSRQLALQPRG